MEETFASYLKESDLNTFWTIMDSLTYFPNPMMELTTSSTMSK
jgi:hypothetical protein